MKYKEAALMSEPLLAAGREVGQKLARLRKARRILQADAAARAGLSRSTAVLLEQGDPGRTLGQILRYLNAIAPGATLEQLLLEKDPALTALAEAERTQRVRRLSDKELKELDF